MKKMKNPLSSGFETKFQSEVLLFLKMHALHYDAGSDAASVASVPKTSSVRSDRSTEHRRVKDGQTDLRVRAYTALCVRYICVAR